MRRTALALAFTIVLGSIASATPAANELLSWSDLCSAVTAATFAWSAGTPAACTSTPSKIVGASDFTGAVTHSGTCLSDPNVPDYSDMLTCRGAGTTQVTGSASVQGVSYTSTANGAPPPNYFCSGSGGPSGSNVSSATTTVAPTTSGTQLTYSVTATTGTVSYTLRNPSGTTLASGSAPVSGATYFASGAAAGSYVLAITTTSQSCNTTTGSVSGTAGAGSGSLSWYQ